jgi:phospholipid-binding lipoprotein MlaA
MKKLFLTTFLSIATIVAFSNIASAAAPTIADNQSAGGDEFDLELSSEYAATSVNDPLESFNRAVFSFNDVVDDFLLEPIAIGYTKVVPEWGQKRVSNFLSNLSEPVNLVNSTLQAKDQSAFTALWRFIINSTFGLLGTFDAASEVGLAKKSESFGETLYVWGVKDSPYLVLPILGPSTLRDGIGFGADYAFNPFNYNAVIDSSERYIIAGARIVDTRSRLLPTTDKLDKIALDRYATYRSSYLQNFAKNANE